MNKIKLGGIKIIEGCSFVSSFCGTGESTLDGICYRMAMERINISLLVNVNKNSDRSSITSICTQEQSSLTSYFLMKLDQECKVSLEQEVSLFSVFPHNERAEVLGAILKNLAVRDIYPLGFASSPSAMAVLVSSGDARSSIDGLFDAFEFPTYRSPLDWYAAYKGKEQLLKEIVCSYEEKLIKVYNVATRSQLELLSLRFPMSGMERLGAALLAMGESGIRIPFVTGQTGNTGDLIMTCCLSASHVDQMKEILQSHLELEGLSTDGPFTALYLHGPHFGDRYGIAGALAGALQLGSVTPVAIGCAVSSISVVVRSAHEDRCIEALRTRFEIPGRIEMQPAG